MAGESAAEEPRESLARRKSKTDEGTISWDTMEAVEGVRSYRPEDKIKSDKFNQAVFVKPMTGKDVTVTMFQREGFENPIHVADKTDLEMKVGGARMLIGCTFNSILIQVPAASAFSVADVRNLVGSRRVVDVINCDTQKNESMTMRDWQRYYEGKDRSRILNVISLEFSNTKLDSHIISPRIVRQVRDWKAGPEWRSNPDILFFLQIDWIDKAWPRHLKELQIEPTNSMDDMMYPKVQKYVLMSVEKCYTGESETKDACDQLISILASDFHIDMGGTSVWYHLLHGRKLFWLIPPTDENLKKYEEWILSGRQSEVFFGDLVENCGRFELCEGSTLFIPSGWIHAVYTRE